MVSVKGFAAVLVGLALALGFSSCATTSVSRVASSDVVDLSGDWNDTDSQQVSTEMVGDSLARPWLGDFVTAKSTKPRVIVGTVMNKSHEHINTETFVADLERELTNSGKVKFVASKAQRDEIRDERADQAQNSSLKTAKASGQEHAADFMLKGKINTIMDEAGAKAVKYYQVELELIDMVSNEKVWIGQKKIKKIVERSKAKF